MKLFLLSIICTALTLIAAFHIILDILIQFILLILLRNLDLYFISIFVTTFIMQMLYDLIVFILQINNISKQNILAMLPKEMPALHKISYYSLAKIPKLRYKYIRRSLYWYQIISNLLIYLRIFRFKNITIIITNFQS